MQKNMLRHTMVLGLLVAASVMVSGCQQDRVSVAVTEVKKEFKTTIAQQDLKEAIIAAAAAHDWQLVSQQDTQTVRFKKIYTKTKKFRSPPSKRGRKYVEEHELYINVELKNNAFTLRSDKSNESYLRRDREIRFFNQDLANLEKSIYAELVSKVL